MWTSCVRTRSGAFELNFQRTRTPLSADFESPHRTACLAPAGCATSVHLSSFALVSVGASAASRSMEASSEAQIAAMRTVRFMNGSLGFRFCRRHVFRILPAPDVVSNPLVVPAHARVFGALAVAAHLGVRRAAVAPRHSRDERGVKEDRGVRRLLVGLEPRIVLRESLLVIDTVGVVVVPLVDLDADREL